ncbi:MAG: metalloregulator ArsR/SmtB family transcription factor, partial [Tepidiformaceae bacterium]
MPSELQPAPVQSRVRVTLAPMLELQFSLYVLERVGVHRGAWMQAWVESFLRDYAAVAGRVAAFWGDAGEKGEFSEMLILADRAGVVFEADPDATWQSLREAAATKIVIPPLPAEAPYVRPLLQSRVDQLRESPELLDRYIAVLRETWAVLKPYWISVGQPAAEELLRRLRPELERGADVRTLLPRNHFARREDHSETVDQAVARGELVVVPLGMAGVGMAFFALPGLTIVALGPDSEKRIELRRKRAEQAASRFKLLSDPTRLSILSVLLRGAHSVTDLAAAFELSQPTVSVHMKML